MDPKTYEIKKTELVGLMSKVLSLPEDQLNGESRLTIEQVRRKANEDQFQIALIAGFQGGKSTTFNALCDGREISPRGSGVKTSATVISAQNTTDPAEAGFAAVTWRSKRELAMVFSSLIASFLRGELPAEFPEGCVVENIMDLDSARHRDIAGNALSLLWDKWRREKRVFSQEDLDTLRIGSLIVTHYADAGIASMRSNSPSRHKVDEIGAMVCFPAGWEKRWAAGDAREFKPDEVRFAFIREVLCKIESPNLARIGCRITDCPGLFASPYDTSVALSVLKDADAVWYLLGGGGMKGTTQISDEDLKQLRTVANSSGDNVFFTINMNGSKSAINHPDAGIVATDLAIMRNNGIDRQDADIHRYHALLALCASNGPKILEKKLDEHSEEKFVQQARVTTEDEIRNVNEAWESTVEHSLSNLRVASRHKVAELTPEAIGIVRQESGLVEIAGAVEKHVVAMKARSVLVDKGAQLAASKLQMIEGGLKAASDDARKEEAAFKAEYDVASKALDEFAAFTLEELEALNNTGIDQALADDFWENVVVKAVPLIAKEAAPSVQKAYGLLGKDNDKVQNALASAFKTVTEPLIIAWLHGVKSGKNKVYETNVATKVDRIRKRVAKKWKELAIKAPRIDGLPMPYLKPDLKWPVVDTMNLPQPSTWHVMFGDTFWATLAGSVAGLLMLGPLSAAIAGIVVVLWRKCLSGANTEEETLKLEESLRKELPAVINQQYRESIKDLAEQLSSYRKAWKMACEQAFEKQRALLKERRQNAEREHKCSVDRREELARQYDETRQKVIEPLRREIQAFQAGVEAVLS